jgi:YVTN family beta-propeller protein
VAVVDTGSLQVIARIPVGDMPWGLAMGRPPRHR